MRSIEAEPAWSARIPIALVTCVLLLSLPVRTNGQPVDTVTEQSIKAAYLYKFAAYVEWPEHVFASKSTPVTIGVYGADALAGELAEITAERTVQGRRIVTRLIRRDAVLDQLDGIHILFIARSGVSDLAALAASASVHSVLVVTEDGEALGRGSVINFKPVDQRIRFDVSLASADKNHLKLSSRLLAVAEHVEPRQN
jgi:hypothetical protein